MSIKRWAARRDANEPEIVAAAERIGLKVCRINDGADLIISYGRLWSVWEVKTEDGRLTDAQCKLRQRGMKPHVVRTVDDVLELHRQMRDDLVKLAR